MQRQGESQEAAPLARSHPANGGFILPHLRSPPGRRSHPDTPGTFFALGGGSAEAVAGSKFRVGGKHKGVCSQSWVASLGSGRGKETLSELQEPVGERCC